MPPSKSIRTDTFLPSTTLFGSRRLGQSGGRRWSLRRLAVLFLIGLLHSAFWWGDILRSYAVAGLLLLPLARMRPRNLAILGVALMCLPHLPWWQGDSSLAPDRKSTRMNSSP